MAEETSRYLIELDVLLDTRLGTVDVMGKNASIDRGAYTVRQDDTMLRKIHGWVSRYKNRDLEVLANSLRTKMVHIANDMILSDQVDPSYAFPDRTYHLQINTYPYDLDEGFRQELLSVMYELFPTVPDIKLVYFSNSVLTPKFLEQSKIDVTVMYDFDSWLKLHKNAIESETHPKTLIIAPMLCTELVSKEKLDTMEPEIKKIYQNPNTRFAAFEQAIAERIAVTFYPVHYFCNALLIHDYEKAKAGISEEG